MGLGLVTFHAGFLPHEESDPSFAKLLARLRQIADLFAAKNMAVGLETGQEEAGTLAAFLKKLDRANVGVNFDPANMILYDKGDPVAALRTLEARCGQLREEVLRRCRLQGPAADAQAIDDAGGRAGPRGACAERGSNRAGQRDLQEITASGFEAHGYLLLGAEAILRQPAGSSDRT
jgi:hypothetical protein